MTRRDLRDVVVGLAALAFIVAVVVVYRQGSSDNRATSSSTTPQTAPAPAPAPAGPRVELVRSQSACAPDPIAGRVDVRIMLRNRGDRARTVHLFVKRSFAGGNDDGNALDVVRVSVPAHGRRPLTDTYNADRHGRPLVQCRLWLDDRYLELPVEGAA